MRLVPIAAVLLLAAPASAQTVTVGTASATRGQTATGVINVPPGSDSGTVIPVAVINGARPGPTVALVAGSHGTEYASIIALQRLIQRLDPKTIAGTLIVAPLVNVPSFRQMTVHLNPTDGKGLNRLYPGDAAGTQTSRALALMAEQVVKPATVIIDLHGGDLDEDLRPYSYWFRGGNAVQDSASKALALAFGLDHIIVQDVDLGNPAGRGTLSGYALSLGKTVLVAEAGRSGVVDAAEVGALIDGMLNVLGVLHVIDRTVRPVEHPVWLDGGVRVAADGDGVFFPSVARGSYVSEGMTVGVLTDFLGRKDKEVKAPAAGVVTFIRGVPSVWKGATLINVGRVLASPPAYFRPGSEE
jgi:predicted deacylase